MSFAYLKCALLYLVQENNKIWVNQELRDLFSSISFSSGKKFTQIDIEQCLKGENLTYYKIDDRNSVNGAVEILVDLIVTRNLTFNGVKEFLITTIGEIFSNALNHSNQNNIMFMHDVECKDEKFNLVISIIDYGKTIITNINEYFESQGKILDNLDCMRWAIQAGNTTRVGSGGYGLPTLIDYVKKVDGELLISSGDVIYALKGNFDRVLLSNGTFYGTNVSIKIPLFNTHSVISYDKQMEQLISINLNDI